MLHSKRLRRGRCRRPRRLVIEPLEARRVMDGQAVITEFLASNSGGLRDGDGNDSDWIELFNAGDAPIDLALWYLTDRADDLTRWQIPDVDAAQLDPGEFLVIFASSQDADDYIDGAGNLHANFALNAGGEYVALVGPDGTSVVSEFGPGGTDYPEQYENLSYGLGQETTVTALVPEHAPAVLLIPDAQTAAAIGSTWTGDGPLDTTDWTPVSVGVGFDTGVPLDPTAADVYRGAVLDDAPIGYWRLDESGAPAVLADQSSAGHGLNVIELSTGAFGQPGIFSDSSGTAVKLSDEKPADTFVSSDTGEFGFAVGESFSVEYWIKLEPGNNSANGAGIVTKGYDSAQSAPWYLSRYSTTGRVDFLLRGGSDAFATSTSTVDDGQWHHVVGVYDAAAAESRLYIDGAQEATVTGVNPAAYGTNDRPLTIGNHLDRTLDADVDEVAIYDAALTSARVLAHYQAATTDPGSDPPIPQGATLKIDFGSSTNDGGGPGGTQAGYLAFEHTGTAAATKTFASELGHGAMVDVSLVGNTHWRDYAAATGPFADRSALLSDGPLCNDNCTITLTFDGLLDGTYELTTYHHTTQFGPSSRPPATPFDIVLTDADVTAATVVSDAEMSDNSSASLSTHSVEFTVSGGGAVMVDFIRGFSLGEGDHFALPGFDLAFVTPPSVGDLVETDIRDAMHEQNASAYLRVPFDVPPEADYDFLRLDVQYDDGFVAYLGGTEVARRSAPGAVGTPPPFDAAATAENPAGNPAIDESINLTGSLSLLRPGETNVLAIHGLNYSAADDDFLIAPQLTATRVTSGVSYFFDTPTPGAPNAEGFVGFVGDTTFSADRGIFDSPDEAFTVEIATDTDGATIVYTVDASLPAVDASGAVTNGFLYTEPILIDRTTTLRAIAFKDGYQTTNVDTQTYLFLDDVLQQNSTPPPGYPSTWNGPLTDWGMDQNAGDLKNIAGDSNYTLEEAQAIIKDSLRTLPTLSLVLPIDDVFGASRGIYANPQGRGIGWERFTSVEYIDPNDATANYQVDAGLRIQGFTSRDPSRNPKHSLRLIFRGEYGAGKLNVPFFGPDAAEEFNTLVLRSNSQDAWVYDVASNRVGQFVRDQWAREAQLAMGQPAAHGNWVHLYINGLYWGVYNPTERPDDDFSESYLGGDAEDYDAIKNHEEVIDGNGAAYFELLSLIQNNPNNFGAGYRDLSGSAAYQRIFGNNPDGTRNADYPVYLNVDSLIDFIIVGTYAAAGDWPGNFYMSRSRAEDSDGFYVYMWDNEHGMKGGVSENRTLPHSRDADSPTKFHQALRVNSEYKLRFADHLHAAYFNGGPLYVDPDNPQWDPEHPERNMPAALWMELTGEIEPSLIAEAVRWGDVRGIQYTPHDQFQNIRNALLANWFPQRSQNVLGQFKSQGLYPNTAAPTLRINGAAQYGGAALTGDPLTLDDGGLAGASVFYSLDGTDPRAVGGAAVGTLYDGQPIILNESTQVMARTRSASGEWSALSTALFEIASPLRVTELYYNPPGSDESTEFVELINTSSGAVALAGYGFDSDGGGIDFTFDDAEPSLGAGERIVVVRNQAAFAAAYDTAGIRLATGQFDDSQTALANGGEMLTLVDASHVVISRFTYDDAWHRETDGDGFSLVVVDTGGDYDDPANWRSSALVGGSPGAADPTPVVGDFNGDGAATRIDAAILLRNLGRSGDAHRGTGDIDGDLATTLIDLALLQSNLGSTIAASAPAGSAQAPDSRNAAIAAVGREGASHASPTATHRRRTRVAFSLGQHERLQSPPVDAAIREASDLADSLRSTRRNTRAGRLLSSPPANVGRPFQAVTRPSSLV